MGAYLFGVQVARSDDGGRTWATNTYVPTVGGDRQWLAFDGDRVYLSFWQIPTGVWIARSDDAGATFRPPLRAAGVEEGQLGSNGPPVVADGRLLLPYAARDGVRVALSDDGATTFRSVRVSDERAADWPVGAVDGHGAVHLLWPRAEGPVRLARSLDGGETWEAPLTWADDWSRGTAAWLVATESGGVRAAWFAEGELRVAFGRSGGLPERTVTLAQGVEAPSGDFAHIAVGPEGRLAATWATRAGALLALERDA